MLLRFIVASIVACPFAFARRRPSAVRSPPCCWRARFYGLAFVIQFEGLAGGYRHSCWPCWFGAMPALIAISAYLIGERVTRASWIGVVAATGGAALIAGKPGGPAQRSASRSRCHRC